VPGAQHGVFRPAGVEAKTGKPAAVAAGGHESGVTGADDG